MYLYCDNLELCPKCGKFPIEWEKTWRITTLKCECGNNYGGVIKLVDGEGTGEDFVKKVYQHWQNGARNELGLQELECEFISFKTEGELFKYHGKKFGKKLKEINQ